MRLRRYGTGHERGPAVLIVPAPIKRPYIWALAPSSSVVERLLAADLRVYLIDWQASGRDLGLFDFADTMLAAAADAIGSAPVLVGHSLGGMLAVLHAALHRSRPAGLVLIGTPMSFDAPTGVFAAMACSGATRGLPHPVPGSLLGAAAQAADPWSFGTERLLDRWRSAADVRTLLLHLRVERWTLDEFPLPRRFVVELADDLVRSNGFMRGTLASRGRPLSPQRLTTPLLAVVDPLCRVVPPETIVPLHDAAASAKKVLLRYDGDIGVGLRHLGPLIGRDAHARLWPRIIGWIGGLRAAG